MSNRTIQTRGGAMVALPLLLLGTILVSGTKSIAQTDWSRGTGLRHGGLISGTEKIGEAESNDIGEERERESGKEPEEERKEIEKNQSGKVARGKRPKPPPRPRISRNRYYLTESPCNHRGFLFLQSPPKHQKHTSIPGTITTFRHKSQAAFSVNTNLR
jgi:hypothetical protein